MGQVCGLAAIALGFSLALTSVAHATSQDDPEEGWSKTRVNTQLIDFYARKVYPCQASAKNHLSCVHLVNGMGQLLKPQQALIPKNSKELKPDMKFSVLEEYGDLALVKIESWGPTATNLRAEIEENRRREEALRTSSRQTFEAKVAIPFETLTYRLLDQVPTQISRQRAIGTAINMMIQVHDGHGRLSPVDAEVDRMTHADTSIFGIGAELQNMNQQTYVASVYEQTPAEKAGLERNDVILAVNGTSASGQSVSQVANMIRGPRGTAVELKIQRGSVVLPDVVRITRDKIDLPNLRVRTVQDIEGRKIAWIRLSTFMDEYACDHIRTALLKLSSDTQGIILDLRGNSGGLMEQAVCIGGLFVGKLPIVKERPVINGETAPETVVFVSSENQATRLPVVTLINSGSASASEIVAGMLQDYHRSYLLGTRSFGKATVQESEILKFQPELVAFNTVGRFYTPSNRTNQVVGITPDFEVYETPHPTDDEKFAVYEADLVPSALPPEGKPWVQLRQQQIDALQTQCLSSRLAEDIFDHKTSKNDFQVLKAQELLSCQIKKDRSH